MRTPCGDTGHRRCSARSPFDIIGRATIAGTSFNGRTGGSGPSNRGSNPCVPATIALFVQPDSFVAHGCGISVVSVPQRNSKEFPNNLSLAVVAACAAPEPEASAAMAVLSPDTPVAVTGGQIRGAVSDETPEVMAFKGIPFAAPPPPPTRCSHGLRSRQMDGSIRPGSETCPRATWRTEWSNMG